MLRSILLALDDTPASLAAKRLALLLAAEIHATVTGLAIIDPEIVAPPEATPLGASDYKEHKDATLVKRAQAAAEEITRAFIEDGGKAGVQTTPSVVTGDVLTSVIAASNLHDMIVAGLDTSFDENSSGKASALIERLLRENPRPIIVCSKEAPAGSRTLVAYDGSVPAMRAMQLFCCLGFRKQCETIVVTVRGTEDAAAAIALQGAEFMRNHEFSASALPLASQESTAAVLIDVAKRHEVGMIVAGAYGHSGWREWLLGSTTKRLLENSPAPVFIHH